MPQHLGVLASIGIAEAPCFQKLKVALLSSGDELAQPGQEAKPGQIYNSNRFSLTGLIQQLGMELIDLALTQGIPDFISTLRIVLSEMQVESHVLAEEILLKQPPALTELNSLNTQAHLGERRLVSHEAFKQLSRNARAIVRTGECQPYCNIALVSGVTF